MTFYKVAKNSLNVELISPSAYGDINLEKVRSEYIKLHFKDILPNNNL